MPYAWERESTQEEREAANAELRRRFSNSDLLTALIKKAVREAILGHKLAGNPIAAMEDGKVVIIQPEDIVVPDEPVFLEEWGEDLTLKSTAASTLVTDAAPSASYNGPIN